MSQSKIEMSSFLAELAGAATQKLEEQRAKQQDRQTLTQNVNDALERTYKFFHLFQTYFHDVQELKA